MLVLAIRFPETPRVGILRIETTRGDRLFITLLGSAFINLAWLGLVGRAAVGRAGRLPRLRRSGLPLGLTERAGRAAPEDAAGNGNDNGSTREEHDEPDAERQPRWRSR